MCAPMNEHSDITDQLCGLLDTGSRRIERVEIDGRLFWIKRPENLKPRMRLQKGSPHAAFERERTALRTLNALGAPVPALLVDRPDVIVTEDSGVDLLRLRRHRKHHDVTGHFFDGGAALAQLHALGHAHGRPALKDICCQPTRATIIDFERAHPALNTRRGMARDVVLLFINGMNVLGGQTPEIDALKDGYRSADQSGLWDAALEWSRNLTWMCIATRPAHWLPLPLVEVRKLPQSRDYFRDQRKAR